MQDRDGVLEDLVSLIERKQRDQGLQVTLLDRHEIESYLLDVPILRAAAEARGKELSDAEATALLLDAGVSIKSAARAHSRKRSRDAIRFLGVKQVSGPDGAKISDADVERRVDDWFDALLSARQVDEFVRYLPGKEYVGAVLAEMSTRLGVEFRVADLLAVITAENMAPSIAALLRRITAELIPGASTTKAGSPHVQSDSSAGPAGSPTEDRTCNLETVGPESPLAVPVAVGPSATGEGDTTESEVVPARSRRARRLAVRRGVAKGASVAEVAKDVVRSIKADSRVGRIRQLLKSRDPWKRVATVLWCARSPLTSGEIAEVLKQLKFVGDQSNCSKTLGRHEADLVAGKKVKQGNRWKRRYRLNGASEATVEGWIRGPS